MKQIILKRIELAYFKGIHSLAVDFDDHIQNIFGANESGKSTVFNAFLWLLFGKDMEGRKDYEIKTTDAQGNYLSNADNPLDHTVTAILLINGVEMMLKRIYREKWTKPRGAVEKVLSGHETEFFWNDVPCREKDYVEKINGIVEENAFKLLTNPLFFNTGLTGYKIPDWQARRNVLLEIAGKITDQQIAAGRPDFQELLIKMGGKSFEDYGKELGARKKKVKDQVEQMPARIDEATRAIPEELDWPAIERQILAKESEIEGLDKTLTDLSEAEKLRGQEQLARQKNIFEHQQRLEAIEQEIKGKATAARSEGQVLIQGLRGQIRVKDAEITTAAVETKRLTGEIETRKRRQDALRLEWSNLNTKQPEARKDDCKCPSCGQDLPADKIQRKEAVYNDYVKTFNENKARRQKEITEEGQRLTAEINTLTESLQQARTTTEELETAMTTLRRDLADTETLHADLASGEEKAIAEQIASNEEGQDLQRRIDALNALIAESKTDEPDNSLFRTKRQGLTRELDEIKKQLFVRQQIADQRARVSHLEKEHAELNQQLADIERIEYTMSEFTKARMALVEERVNSKFKYARFKLFDTQVNGQEVPCCETMYRGVVFGTLNTAAKILVGIDIINVLSEHYGVSAPIFLDNRESVTSIPDTDGQIINLIVSPDDKQLRVA